MEGGEKRVERATAAFYVFFPMANGAESSLPEDRFSLHHHRRGKCNIVQSLLSWSGQSWPLHLQRKFHPTSTPTVLISKENSGLHSLYSVSSSPLTKRGRRRRCRPNYLAERQPRHRRSLCPHHDERRLTDGLTISPFSGPMISGGGGITERDAKSHEAS